MMMICTYVTPKCRHISRFLRLAFNGLPLPSPGHHSPCGPSNAVRFRYADAYPKPFDLTDMFSEQCAVHCHISLTILRTI